MSRQDCGGILLLEWLHQAPLLANQHLRYLNSLWLPGREGACSATDYHGFVSHTSHLLLYLYGLA